MFLKNDPHIIYDMNMSSVKKMYYFYNIYNINIIVIITFWFNDKIEPFSKILLGTLVEMYL